MKKFLFFVVCSALVSVQGFSQASLLRDYVGVIHQTYHPETVAYMNKLKDYHQKKGNEKAVKNIEEFLKGGTGSGFVYVDTNGSNYVITNNHVVRRAHTISIEFEKPDGTKTTYENLVLLEIDEDVDIAILTFEGGKKPFKQGLVFADKLPEDGDEVFSAGYPGLGPGTSEVMWQFGNGRVSNANAKLPKLDEFDTAIGPYIQHSAQVDPGNSGGPLLVSQKSAPTGFAVCGINTLSARFRQATNWSIPVTTAKAFVKEALQKKSEATLKTELDKRLETFISSLSQSKAVYPYIARYVSNDCVSRNAEFAISEVEDKANAQARGDIFDQSLFSTMDYAVSWMIETDFRSLSSSGGVMHPVLGDVTKKNDKNYEVVVVFNGKNGAKQEIKTVWVNEYGVWRINDAGKTEAAGKMKEKEEKNKKEQTDSSGLRKELGFSISAGYAHLGMQSPAFEASIMTRWFGMNVLTQGEDFTLVEGTLGFGFPIVVKNKMTFFPYAHFGFGTGFYKEATKYYEFDGSSNTKTEDAMTIGVVAQFGLMYTTANVPGLFAKAAYEFRGHMFSGHSNDELLDETLKNTIFVGIGYMF